MQIEMRWRLVCSDRQMFWESPNFDFPKGKSAFGFSLRNPNFDFICYRLFDPEELGAVAGQIEMRK